MSKINVKTCEQFSSEGKTPEILFWIGCSGSFDDRAKKITKAFIKILNHAKKLILQYWEKTNLVQVILQKGLEMNFYFKCKHCLI